MPAGFGSFTRRIGTIGSLSEYTPARIVQGTNGSPPKPWNDILYDYFLANYAASVPSIDKFDLQNEPPNPKSTYHVYVLRGQSLGDHKQAKTITHYEENYIFQVYVRKKSVGELFPELENIIGEIKRIFIEEYESHAIAGLRVIDNLRMSQASPPETARNPFKDIWLIEIEVTVFYAVQVLLSPDSYVYNGHKYSAGSFRKTF